MTDAEIAPAAITVAEVRVRLAAFLSTNSCSTIEEFDSPEGKRIGVQKPWGDDSIVLYIPRDVTALANALNNVYLPERLTAIWHKDSRDMEVIWTAFKIPPAWQDVQDRKFTFKHLSKSYDCEFGKSSERLLAIAEAAEPVSASQTGHRNLVSFHNLVMFKKDNPDSGDPLPFPLGEPQSFWVRNIDWEEDEFILFARHLNFYMTYFDAYSPEIIIHSPKSGGTSLKERTRYRAEKFPSVITSRPIDDGLLHFWKASREGDSARRFLYLYRIIEYAAFFHVEDRIHNTVQKILTAPDVLSDIKGVSEKVIAAALESKMHDSAKILQVLKTAVEPKILWREIERNKNVFTSKTTFDGGFSIDPLVTREEDFANKGIENFSTAIRDIRNALSHGRDQKTTEVITPTHDNFEKLKPWVYLISTAAGEVMVYNGLL